MLKSIAYSDPSLGNQHGRKLGFFLTGSCRETTPYVYDMITLMNIKGNEVIILKLSYLHSINCSGL